MTATTLYESKVTETTSVNGYHFDLVIDGKRIARGSISFETAVDGGGIERFVEPIRQALAEVEEAYKDGTLYPR